MNERREQFEDIAVTRRRIAAGLFISLRLGERQLRFFFLKWNSFFYFISNVQLHRSDEQDTIACTTRPTHAAAWFAESF